MVLTSISQGIAGLTERDVKLVQEGGFHTVESIAYTYVPFQSRDGSMLTVTQTKKSVGTNQGNIRSQSC